MDRTDLGQKTAQRLNLDRADSFLGWEYFSALFTGRFMARFIPTQIRRATSRQTSQLRFAGSRWKTATQESQVKKDLLIS